MWNKLGCLCGTPQQSPSLPPHKRTQSDSVVTPTKGFKRFKSHGPTTESTPFVPQWRLPPPPNRRLSFDDSQIYAPQPKFKSRMQQDCPSPEWIEREETQYDHPSFDDSKKWLPYSPPHYFRAGDGFRHSRTPDTADLTPFEIRAALDRADRLEREKIRNDMEKCKASGDNWVLTQVDDEVYLHAKLKKLSIKLTQRKSTRSW